jgi:hypothetical protein
MRISSGHITALRLYNLAHEIDLAQVEQRLDASAAGTGTRSRLLATPEKAVAFGVPPLAIRLGQVELSLRDRPVQAQASAKLYDFGIVAFSLTIAADGLLWADFEALTNQIDQAVETAAGRAIWTSLIDQTRSLVGSAAKRPQTNPLEEDYLLAVVERFDAPLTAKALQDQVDFSALLSGEERPLSDWAKRELTGHIFSYYVDDLVAVAWDRAFIYEPQGVSDVADVLEIANAQLLEMRVYDTMLDHELPIMHDLVESARSGANLFAARRYAKLAQKLQTLVAEVTELKEHVDNALQVTEDVYLARVYATAMDLFRVPNVTEAVDRKLAIIRDTYAALHSEAAGSRAELLEIAILVIIFLELLLSLFRR